MIEIILPEGSFGSSDDAVSVGLRLLTKLIDTYGLSDKSGGLLGGEYGYGCDYENDVFSMFPFYWGDCNCEDEHEDGCPELRPNFFHKGSGLMVSWYKYIGRGMDVDNPNNVDWTAVLGECINSLKEDD